MCVLLPCYDSKEKKMTSTNIKVLCCSVYAVCAAYSPLSGPRKIHNIRKISNAIRYESVYHPAFTTWFFWVLAFHLLCFHAYVVTYRPQHTSMVWSQFNNKSLRASPFLRRLSGLDFCHLGHVARRFFLNIYISDQYVVACSPQSPLIPIGQHVSEL